MNAVKPTEVMPRCRGTDELETSMSFTGTQLKMQKVQAAMKKKKELTAGCKMLFLLHVLVYNVYVPGMLWVYTSHFSKLDVGLWLILKNWDLEEEERNVPSLIDQFIVTLESRRIRHMSHSSYVKHSPKA